MLQPVRGRIPAVLGDRPAILAILPRDHPAHQLGRMPQRLIPGKSLRDRNNHRRELSPPPIRVYAMGRGDRGQFWSLHKPRTLPRSPPLPVKTRQTTTVTNYGCSTSSIRVEGWLISVPPTEPGMTCVRADCLRCDYTVLRNGDRSAD